MKPEFGKAVPVHKGVEKFHDLFVVFRLGKQPFKGRDCTLCCNT